MNTPKTKLVLVLSVSSDDVDRVNPAYVAYVDAQTELQRRAWSREGVGEYYLDALCDAFRDKLLAMETPWYAARFLLVEVADAKRETLFDDHARRLAEQFHLPKEVARGLIQESKKLTHKNARPDFNAAIAPVFAQVKFEEHKAYVARAEKRGTYAARRAKASPLAAALIRSGITS